MVREDFKGDFTGFSFGGIHSSELGIVRVSSGDRYNENLQPEIKDTTAEVPGMDGEYFFNSTYGKQTFDIEFAFDSLTESEFRKLRKIFSVREPQELIFDERPYKTYMAKIENPIELSYVCFDEPKRIIDTERDGLRVIDRVIARGIIGEARVGISQTDNEDASVVHPIREKVTPYKYLEGQRERIYKGDGKISFVCYFPFAKSTFKVLPESGQNYYNGREGWAFSSGILTLAEYNDEHKWLDRYEYEALGQQTGSIGIYNAGDIPTGFRLYCSFDASTSLYIRYRPDRNISSEYIRLNIDPITPLQNNTGYTDIGFLVNTTNGLIQGVQSINGNTVITSNNIYNKYVSSGYFFKLEPNDINHSGLMWLRKSDNSYITTGTICIFYDYLYF